MVIMYWPVVLSVAFHLIISYFMQIFYIDLIITVLIKTTSWI